MNNIYKDMTSEEIDILSEILGRKVRSNIHINNNFIPNGTRYWMAIFAGYLERADKTLLLHSNRYYYKQEHLDTYYPTNETATRIAPPFDTSAANANYEIYYIDTTTGAKIYEYISQLCKKDNGYVDKHSLAISLTQSKQHKVKIIRLNNTVWILSNDINTQLVEQSLTLFPFLFDIEELQKDETIIKCCKAVANDEPVRDCFKSIFDGLADIRKQKKINAIKSSLNSRIQSKVNQLERDIRNAQSRLNDYEDQIREYYNKIDDLTAQKLGYESKEKASDETVAEILDFAERNRYIQNLGTMDVNDYSGTNTQLQLDIIAPITIYETEPLERQINNRISDYNQNDIKTKILKALRRIFIDEELQMLCQTFVLIDIANNRINASKDNNRKNYTDFVRMPQPHLVRYNCWGDNMNTITKLLNDSDVTAAMNNMVIAAQNINFTDTVVLNSWLETICNNSCLFSLPTCLSKVDGNLWSIKDIIDQIDREEAAQREEEPESEEIGHPELEDEIPF